MRQYLPCAPSTCPLCRWYSIVRFLIAQFGNPYHLWLARPIYLSLEYVFYFECFDAAKSRVGDLMEQMQLIFENIAFWSDSTIGMRNAWSFFCAHIKSRPQSEYNKVCCWKACAILTNFDWASNCFVDSRIGRHSCENPFFLIDHSSLKYSVRKNYWPPILRWSFIFNGLKKHLFRSNEKNDVR